MSTTTALIHPTTGRRIEVPTTDAASWKDAGWLGETAKAATDACASAQAQTSDAAASDTKED